MKIERHQINETREIDIDEFVRRLKAHQDLYKPEPYYEELDHEFNRAVQCVLSTHDATLYKLNDKEEEDAQRSS